jgi:hypothetical protein
MKPRIILKSFEELSAEQLVMVTTLPAMVRAGPVASAAVHAPRRMLAIKWNETGKSMRLPLQPIEVITPDSWTHWGLNE